MDWITKGQQWDRAGNKIEKLFRYTLSANFHGGTKKKTEAVVTLVIGDVVVNYPYDGNGKGREKGITDDDLLFKHLATYDKICKQYLPYLEPTLQRTRR